jgi:Ca2+-binding EF-hand superfamily protein
VSSSINSIRAQSANVISVLTNLGEKMSDDEVDELLKAVDTTSGEINYTGMSAIMLTEF